MHSKIAFAAEIREADRVSIEEYGVPGVALMENAGRATALLVDDVLGERSGASYVRIFCGAGNYGGDGYVIARHLLARGHDVDVYLLAPRDRIHGDADTNLTVLERMGSCVGLIDVDGLSDDDFGQLLGDLTAPCDAVVDALLGTGLESEVRGRYQDIIAAINELDTFVVAVDIPSGLSADTGQPLGCCVRANLTATYGLAKPGLLLTPGRSYCGHVELIDI